jgi:uncharacterized protein (TIGR03000 family)
MFSKCICGTLTTLLLPVGLAVAQPADGRSNEYPGGQDVMSWISDASRSDAYRRDNGNFGRPTFQGQAYGDRYPYKRYAFSYQAYATGPPNWTPGYSYPYGYASSWYPYSSWRGLGNEDNAFPNYDYNVYSPIPSVYGASFEQAYGVSRAFTASAYAAPGYTSRSLTNGLTSPITITAPSGADIWMEGAKVVSGEAAAVHTLQTPPLDPAQQYRYQVRAVWTDSDGRTVDQTQKVDFSAGAGVTVRFPTAPATRTMEAMEK